MSNVVLCGFMGCGKSTVGRRLSTALGYTFVDMDAFIEQDAGMTVSDIFAAEGEAGFRRREHDACVTLGARDGLVIATGGGAVLRPDNVAALQTNGTLVWLRVSAATVIARLKDDTTRPLLQREDKEAAVEALLTERLPLYRQAASVHVDADDSPETVVNTVLTCLQERNFL